MYLKLIALRRNQRFLRSTMRKLCLRINKPSFGGFAAS